MTDVTGLELVGAGRTADVYALGDGRVLRRYRDGGPAAPEAAVMTHVRAHGFPAPAVHEVTGPDLVLDRLTGPTLLEAVLDGRRTVGDAATARRGADPQLTTTERERLAMAAALVSAEARHAS